uniref:Uncharacterized protein n=1 Tax=Meloidogyne javanica TaxID=6303 RepID=A0A915LHR4_MELJA
IYPSIKFIREHCSDILTFLEEEKIENEEEEGGEKGGEINLFKEFSEINWQIIYELETFLEPFYETSQIFLDLNKPHFHKILPELFALIHECQQSTIKEEKKEIFCLSSVRLSATLYLKEWANKNICLEHRVATALNPRLRHLPLICSDSERLSVYEKIREMANLDKKPKESIKTKLARFLLAISVAPLPLINKKGGVNSGLNSEEIGILLNLRPNILNSVVNHQLSRYKIQQHQ